MAESIVLPVRGVVDGAGRLKSADPLLLRLQEEAGAGLGSMLAVPQLASLVRLARRLGVTLSRPALAGTAQAELDLWVRAEPGEEEVRLVIEQWTERPLPRGRWAGSPVLPAVPSGMSDLSFALDASLRFTSIGRELARQVGAGEDSLSGTPLTRTLELEADTNGDLPLLQALATRSSFAGQKAHARRGGAALLLSAEPQLSEDGAFLGYRGTAVPAALGAAEATDSSAEWDALLRQPLDVIVTEAERISDRTEGPLRSDYAAYASDIAGAARHLLDVLRSMGQDAAEPDASNEPIDLAALGAEAAGLVQPQAAEAGVTLELEGATTLPAVGQPRAVTQILVNLIGNAVRYSPRGSVVRIEAEAGANASISVTDNGPGVAAEDQKRIFERFEQVSSQGAGAGLGLTISRRLARSMGGDISLTSTPGAGARFTLALPPR